eukprot:s1329_g11.t4
MEPLRDQVLQGNDAKVGISPGAETNLVQRMAASCLANPLRTLGIVLWRGGAEALQELQAERAERTAMAEEAEEYEDQLAQLQHEPAALQQSVRIFGAKLAELQRLSAKEGGHDMPAPLLCTQGEKGAHSSSFEAPASSSEYSSPSPVRFSAVGASSFEFDSLMSADSMWQVVLHLVLLSQLRPLSLQAELESALAGKRKADEENRQLQLGLLQHQKVLEQALQASSHAEELVASGQQQREMLQVRFEEECMHCRQQRAAHLQESKLQQELREEASDARQRAAEHQQRAREAELQESKLHQELQEEVEAHRMSRAALVAEHQAQLQEQQAHRMSRAALVAEHQAQLQEQQALSELSKNSTTALAMQEAEAIRGRRSKRIRRAERRCWLNTKRTCRSSRPVRLYSELLNELQEHAEEAQVKESNLERGLQEEIEAHQKSRVALTAEYQAQLQEQQALSELSKNSTTALAMQEAEASDARQRAAEHQQRAREAELQESKLERQLQEELEAHHTSRAALVAEYQEKLQEQQAMSELSKHSATALQEAEAVQQQRVCDMLQSEVAKMQQMLSTPSSPVRPDQMEAEDVLGPAMRDDPHRAASGTGLKDDRVQGAFHALSQMVNQLNQRLHFAEQELKDEMHSSISPSTEPEMEQRMAAQELEELQAERAERRAMAEEAEERLSVLLESEVTVEQLQHELAQKDQEASEIIEIGCTLAQELEELQAERAERRAMAEEAEERLSSLPEFEVTVEQLQHELTQKDQEASEIIEIGCTLAQELEELQAERAERRAMAEEAEERLSVLQESEVTAASDARQLAAEHQQRAEQAELQESKLERELRAEVEANQNSGAALVAEHQAQLQELQAMSEIAEALAMQEAEAQLGEQAGERAARGGGRNSFAWAVVIPTGVSSGNPVLLQVQASQKSRAALAAECQAQLQEQQAMSEIATALAMQEAEASESRQQAAELQKRAEEAELQESKLARELREEGEANQKSRAALVAEQQALLQEQRAPVQAIGRFDLMNQRASEARQRAAEYQQRAKEAELQESKLERELQDEVEVMSEIATVLAMQEAEATAWGKDKLLILVDMGKGFQQAGANEKSRAALVAEHQALLQEQRASEARQRAAEHQPRAEEAEFQERQLLLERELREEVEANEKSRAALVAEHQALLQEQSATSAISEHAAAALAIQEAEASEARHQAAEHQQRAKEAELQESNLARELREEVDAGHRSRAALVAEQQALLQEQRASEARQRAAEHQPRAQEAELQESKSERELREEVKESQNSRVALVAECQALLEKQQATSQFSMQHSTVALAIREAEAAQQQRICDMLQSEVAKMEQLSSTPSSQVRPEQVEAEDIFGHAVPGAPQRVAPGTDLKDDQMQHVLNSLSRLTRKLTQRLHLAEQELKDEMRCALKAQKEVQDQRMQQAAALADKEAEMQKRLAQLERGRMESSRKSQSLQAEAENSAVAAAVGQAEAKFEESMQQLRTEVSLEKSQHAANVSQLKQHLIQAGIEAQIREEDVARMVHFELQQSRQECDSLRRDASATMTAELVAIKEEAAAVARSHAQLLSAKNELQDELLALQQQSVVDLAATQRSERAAAALRSLVADIRHAEEGAAAREAAAIEELTATRGRFEIQTTELEAAKSDELRSEQLLHAAHEVQCMLHDECGALTAHVERAATAESVAQARAAELDEQRQVLRQECQRLRSDNVLLRRQLHGGSPALQDIKIVAAARGRP